MTHDEFPHTFRGKLIELGKIAGSIAAILALFTLLFGWIGPIRTVINTWTLMQEDVVRVSDELGKIQEWQSQHAERMSELQENQEFILLTLDGLTKPREIFETNVPLSGARDGFCVLGEPCGIDVRIRRTVEGMECVVIPGEERFYFVEVESGSRIQVFRSSGTPITNVGRDWFDYHWTFETPSSLIKPSGFMYEFAYQGCRGPQDETIIRQESQIVPVEVYTEQEARLLDQPAPGP